VRLKAGVARRVLFPLPSITRTLLSNKDECERKHLDDVQECF